MRPPGLSGYLAVYNDWDALAPSLASMAPWLDELVVVDGGYQWMAEYLTRIGRDPARSDAPVYQALAAFPKPVTIISRVWRNEIEKRMAGYQACTRRHVFRLGPFASHFPPAARKHFPRRRPGETPGRDGCSGANLGLEQQ